VEVLVPRGDIKYNIKIIPPPFDANFLREFAPVEVGFIQGYSSHLINVNDVLFSRICMLEDDTTYHIHLLRLWMFSVFVYHI
jgi:hypothetical protein